MWYVGENVWRQRVALSLPMAAAVSTNDWDWTINPEFDEFWRCINLHATNDGTQIRVTSAHGSLIDYIIDDGAGGAFGATQITNRTGRIRTNGADLPNLAGSVALFWLYFDPATQQASAANALATYGNSPLTARLELGVPGEFRFSAGSAVAGENRPKVNFTKRTAEVRHLWVDMTPVLEKRKTTAYGKTWHEECAYATYEVRNTSNSAEATMIDATKLRWASFGDAVWLTGPVQLGSDDTYYTAVFTVRTRKYVEPMLHNTIEVALGYRVRDTRHT